MGVLVAGMAGALAASGCSRACESFSSPCNGSSGVSVPQWPVCCIQWDGVTRERVLMGCIDRSTGGSGRGNT